MMAYMTIFFVASLLLFLSAVHAIEFFQTVTGNCSDLPTIQELDHRRMATGVWYYHYMSFGQQGDQCSTGHAVARGLKVYSSILLFSSEMNRYISLPVDFTYQPDKPVFYIDNSGGVVHVIAIDSDGNNVVVQCMEVEGQTKVMAMLETRSPKFEDKAERFYKNVTKTLKKLNLLPKMHLVPQTHCPPLEEIKYL